MLPGDLPDVPTCRNPHDQVFLKLAKSAEVDFLVTGDADLLALAGGFALPIVTGEEFAGRLE